MTNPSQRGRGLRGRLIVLVLISILPMLAFAGILLFEVATTERNTLEARMQDTARSLSLIVDQEIGRTQSTITALAASTDLDIGNLEGFDAQARRIASDPDHGIILFNTRRDQFVNTFQAVGTALPQNIPAPAVDEVLRTDRPTVTNLLPSAANSEILVVRTAVPVIRNGEIVYVVTLSFTIDALSRLIAAQDLPATWRVDLQDRTGRLMARSSAHDILTRTAWEGANLADVVRAALAPFDSGHQRIHFAGPALTIAPNVAVALSMAFHELATNAAKYGALSGADGRVTVIWTLAEGAATTIIHW